MENTKINLPDNPKESANPISTLLFYWTLPIFKKGYQKHLEVDDLYRSLKKDKSDSLGDILERHYTNEVEKCKKANKQNGLDKKAFKHPSLTKALFKTFWKELVVLALLIILNELIIRLTIPVVLGKLLEYFKPGATIPTDEALWYAVGIVALSGVNVVSINHYMLNCFHMGMRARIAVCSLIYRKSLKLSRTALGESAPGKIVNLLSNDVNRFDIVSVFIHYLWAAPVASLLALYFIFLNVGISGVVGVGVVFTVMPIQAYAGKLSSRFRLQTAMKTDERVRLMGEIISGVQVIKMYAWEKPFQALITLARKLELKVIRKTSYVRAVYMTFLMTTTRIAVYFVMLMMYFLDYPITAAQIFVVSTYFNLLSSTISAMFVRAIAEIAEARVAMKRLQRYLEQDEFVKTKSNRSLMERSLKSDGDLTGSKALLTESQSHSFDRHSVRISRAECQWLPESLHLTLNLNGLDVQKGKLIGVIGAIGSGKSSFLQMILGELPLLSGSVEVDPCLSYACQEPWVFGATVRQNILFGIPYEKTRYKEVIKVCALTEDLAQFPQGDQTLIGERGASLSGGQKARINLARAVYRKANLYLLDDPLSAVDTHVGKHLFEKCICEYLAGKTRILVTHQLHYLKDADYIIFLKDGKIELQGTYTEITNSKFEFSSLLAPIQEDQPLDIEDSSDKHRERHYSYSKHTSSRKGSFASQHTHMSGTVNSAIISSKDIYELSNEADKDSESINEPQTIQAEASSKGVVKGSVGLKYLKAGANPIFFTLVLFLFLFSQVLASAADYWMSFWTSQEELRKYNATVDVSENNFSVYSNDNVTADDGNDPSAENNLMSSETCLTIYSGIIAFLILCTFVRSFSFYNVCLSASQKLHDLMFRGLIRSPMRFFFVNPSGRIMNRFSKDMGSVDELLPKAILDSSQVILQMVGTIILACYVNYYFIIPIIVLSIVFMLIRKYYLKTSKNIKRLEGIARSPVFTHLNATLQGLSTIRAYGRQNILKDEFDHLQDTHTSAHYLFITTSSAFGILLDLLCLTLVAFVTFSFFYITLDGNDVGLAITQTLSLTFMMQWGIRQSAEVANQLMAVERMLEYTQLPAERGVAPDEIDKKSKHFKAQRPLTKPSSNWPEEGQLQFIDLCMKYSEEEDDVLVLKGLNCTIYPTEKIGIVGRTGAGKSSIISALFRLAYSTGDIYIDNLNTGDISVEDLRKKISIIPQDPVLFSGTLRRNLDPFEEYSDSALWKALDEVELRGAVDGPAGLESKVMDGGSNFSVGQRQLICLARAILRNNKILMLDEATANVDPYTDGLIQKTIREKFQSCTVLTVAHRLNTIMDSDRVLIMDQGQIADFDHPYRLLRNTHSLLHKMSQETGEQNFNVLLQIAKEAYKKKTADFHDDDIKMIDE